MSEKKYSDMTVPELRTEIGNLKEKSRKAEQLGMVNEYAVYERKALMAQAFLIDPATIKQGEIYRIVGDPGVFFQVEYLKGRFAWGYRLGGDKYEEALPISMLESLEEGK
ncbi:YfhH family protein [Psychrobacillus psychrodurans]|uniref:YfhH family protein n=1 Tax=Psychrobacillus psychrodurans TaxID=126157 RepID=A0A9X3LAA8_9BACI|nr:YfhH family protein [Psychrobacillus psychrodurans]MCZ8534148.1 YfhH family protein [Psychrobacillus psychrodurans]